MGKKSLYDKLGVDNKASSDEIKKAYKDKAKEHHPDKPGGDAQKMTEIALAYDILKDPSRRKRYDETGQENEAPFDKRFQEFIQVLFIRIIDSEDDVESVDMVFKLRSQANNELKGAKINREQLAGRKKKLQKVFDRLSSKKENRISHVLIMNIDEMKIQIGLIDDHIKFLNDVIECLGHYNYKFEEPNIPENGYGSTIRWSMEDEDVYNAIFGKKRF